MRGLKVGFDDHLVMDGLDLDLYRGEVLGFVGASGAGKSVLTSTILGLLPKQRRHDRSLRPRYRHADPARADRHRRALGRAVPGGGAVFQPDGPAEHPGADARAPRPVSGHARRPGGAEAGAGRPAAGRARQVSLRAFGRHDQAGVARPGARARSGDRLSRRADLRARSDLGRAISTISSARCRRRWG